MRSYLELLDEVLHHGVGREDRTGVGTRGLFGRQLRFDLADGFPLVTTKKLHVRSIFYELLWFLRGDTNVRWLQDRGVTIWDEWADKDGDLGPVYGHQWRSWPKPDGSTVDQIAQVQREIREHPESRRLIVSAWKVADVAQMALPPCHLLFQFHVAQGRLSCQLYQRSADLFLGVPFNIASYALLTMMMAKVTGLQPGEFIHTMGDVHLYNNHVDQAEQQLSREPRPLPKMTLLRTPASIDGFQYEDFQLTDYDPHPPIKAPVAVLSREHAMSHTKPLIAVVAMTPEGVIGRDGRMPWRLRSDLQRFKRLTMGGVLIMGRKTYDSIGRPLPGRRTVVLTRNPDWSAEGVLAVGTIDEVIASFEGDQGFVVGGAEIYRLLLPMCRQILLTRVLADVRGDTVLQCDLSDFRVEESTRVPAGDHDEFPTEFLRLTRQDEKQEIPGKNVPRPH